MQEEHDHDEYTYQEQDDEEYNDRAELDDLSGFRSGDSSTSNRYESAGRRRSTRAAVTNGHRNNNGNGSVNEWRGERRSRRLGASEIQVDEPPPKRARTEDSVMSSNSVDVSAAAENGRTRTRGAAAIKPTETAVEVVPGKKKSKFWFYAVEPIAGAPTAVSAPPETSASLNDTGDDVPMNGLHLDDRSQSAPSCQSQDDVDIYHRSIEGSPSPTSVMDES